jgi:hypothetical protein
VIALGDRPAIASKSSTHATIRITHSLSVTRLNDTD